MHVTFFLISLALTAVIISEGAESSSCPQHVTKVWRGYTAVHNHVCYLFVNFEVYWRQAREKCWDMGGEMLVIESQETMDFIRHKLNSPHMNWDREGVWLGAKVVRGEWRWTNGRAMNYSNWAPGEPSKLLGFLSVEDCSQMRQDDGWKWHDIPCGSLSFHYNYICQFPLNKPGDGPGRLAPSAANQTEDNGNSSILTIIISVSTGLLLIMSIIFVVLYVHQRRSKQKASETTVHFTNNTYHRTSITPASWSTHTQPTLPTSQVPAYSYCSNGGVGALLDKQMAAAAAEGTTASKPHPSKDCNCVHFQAGVSNSGCSSPGNSSEFGACGGSDPEQEMKVPLMSSTASSSSRPLVGVNCCCSVTQGVYIDMNNLAHKDKKDEGDKHLYSNVDHRDAGNENLYEVLP